MSQIPELRIRSLQGDYSVEFSESIWEALQSLPEMTSADFVVCDARVWEIYSNQLLDFVGNCPVYLVDADETTKSLDGVSTLVNWLIAQQANRSSHVLAIGGGCIQDLVGFTTHIYYRGIPWTFVPTTLLAQADSCIGAKTGINVLPFKNQLGVLHSPKKVLVASEFLHSLPEVEHESGFGEILKLSVTSSRYFLDEVEEALKLGGLKTDRLLSIIHASLRAKQEIIEEDEYESDLRRVLNYGHSFGHALEALNDHKIPHGLAVLWGMDIINWLGVRWGITDAAVANRLRNLTKMHFVRALPLTPSSDALLDMVRRDKKVANGLINFAVLVRPGHFVIEPRSIDSVLQAEVSEYLQSEYVFRAD
jgi:3-dehydroquinate synthase